MRAEALLKEIPRLSDGNIDSAMKGNICCCGTCQRIRQAIHTAATAGGKS